MTTPNLTGAIASCDEAISSIVCAKRTDEAPLPVLNLALIAAHDLRELLLIFEREAI